MLISKNTTGFSFLDILIDYFTGQEGKEALQRRYMAGKSAREAESPAKLSASASAKVQTLHALVRSGVLITPLQRVVFEFLIR